MATLLFIYISFFLSVTEEIFFVIPSTLTQVTIGGLMISMPLTVANFGYFMLFLVIPGALGVAVGAIPIFLLARYGLAVSEKESNRLQVIIYQIRNRIGSNQKGSLFIFFLMRLMPNFSGLVATILGGLWGMKTWNFFILTFLGSIIRIAILGMVGWQFSHYAYLLTGKYGWIGLTSGIVVILLIGLFLFKKKR
ncbi:MAG TPA: VTT domain-containing protein [Candidatus Paceibacterota bacterium]|nr:VTT domain-containing protein [Candidatus Paceibacterota bacterium]HRZ34328.1 VTT domain-containing protein [Candidatus Paceibacterota bacterium]